MKTARYRITSSDGLLTVVGAVQGAGGLLSQPGGLATLRAASAGRSWLRGDVRVYPDWSPSGDGDPVLMPLLGATIELEDEI